MRNQYKNMIEHGALSVAVCAVLGVGLWLVMGACSPSKPEPPCPAEHLKTRPVLVCSGQSTLKLVCREKTETYCEVKP